MIAVSYEWICDEVVGSFVKATRLSVSKKSLCNRQTCKERMQIATPRNAVPPGRQTDLYLEKFVRTYDQELAYCADRYYIAVGLRTYFQFVATPDDN